MAQRTTKRRAGAKHKGWFDRCVSGVKKSGGASDAEAVCGSVLKRKRGQNPGSELFVKFGSHRSRDKALRLLDRKPQGYYSMRRDVGHGGLYGLTQEEFEKVKHIKGVSLLRGPYDDLGKTYSVYNPKSNPESTSASMYSSFHGTPSTSIDEYEEKEHYHSNLAALGELVGLKVRTVSGYDVTLGFESGKASNPRSPKLIHGHPIVKSEKDALYVYDVDADEIVATAPGMPWGLSKSKGLREKGSGHKVVYLGWKEGTGNPKRQSNLWPFDVFGTHTTIYHVGPPEKKSKAKKAAASSRVVGEFRGYSIEKREQGFVAPKLDPDVYFDRKDDVKLFIASMLGGGKLKKNPLLEGREVRCRYNPKHKYKRGPRLGPFADSQQFVGDTVGAIYRPIDEFTGVVTGALDKGLGKVGLKGNPTDWMDSRDDWFPTRETADQYAENFKGTGRSLEIKKIFEPGTRKPFWMVGFKGEGKESSHKRRRNPDHVLLCSTEDGKNLQLIGGSQELDLDALKIDGPLAEKELVTVGEIWGINYFTAKVFGDGGSEDGETQYIHILGPKETKPARGGDLWDDAVPPKDDTFGTGELPTLVYDKRNQKLILSGGMYHINQPLMGTSPGLEN